MVYRCTLYRVRHRHKIVDVILITDGNFMEEILMLVDLPQLCIIITQRYLFFECVDASEASTKTIARSLYTFKKPKACVEGLRCLQTDQQV